MGFFVLAIFLWVLLTRFELLRQNFVNISIIFPPTPAPERKEPKPPKTPKSKRKAEQRAEQNRDEPDPSKPKVLKIYTVSKPDPSKPKVFKLSQNNNT